jgi:hypothetical protein
MVKRQNHLKLRVLEKTLFLESVIDLILTNGLKLMIKIRSFMLEGW